MITKVKYVPFAFRPYDEGEEKFLTTHFQKQPDDTTLFIKELNDKLIQNETSNPITERQKQHFVSKSEANLKLPPTLTLLPIKHSYHHKQLTSIHMVSGSVTNRTSNSTKLITSRRFHHKSHDKFKLDDLLSLSKQPDSQLAATSKDQGLAARPSIIKTQRVDPADKPNTDSTDSLVWKCRSKVVRLNNAYRLHQIHFEQKLDQQWKNDAVIQLLQRKLLYEGQNEKVGLREIFIVTFAERYKVKGNFMKKQSINAIPSFNYENMNRLMIYQYHVPVYRKVTRQEELTKDWESWLGLFIEVFKMQVIPQFICFWLLDGHEIEGLDQIPTYEKIIYMTIRQKFNLWQEIGDRLKIAGQFQTDKYESFLTVCHALKTKEDVKLFFHRRGDLVPFYGQDTSNWKAPQKKQIHLSRDGYRGKEGHQQRISIEREDRSALVNDFAFDKQFALLEEETQTALIEVIQQLMNLGRAKYKHQIKNLQEALEQRFNHIRDQRTQTMKQRAQKYQTMTQIRIDKSYGDIEDELLDEDIPDIPEIIGEAHREVQSSLIYHTRKQNPLCEVVDPFELLSEKDMRSYEGFLSKVNLAKIMFEKGISRHDAVNYLTVFKCLMDTDMTYGSFQKTDSLGKKIPLPKLILSKKQLVKCIPYVVIHKNTLSVNKLNDILKTEIPYINFMEFLDVFSNASQEDVAIDREAFI